MKRLSELEVVFVDTVRALRLMMDDLQTQSMCPGWHLNVDLEGIKLSRYGEIRIGQFAGKGSRKVYLGDFVAMNPFTGDGRLEAMLSSESVLKLLFDPRNDADALAYLYGVPLRGVLCLQLADSAHHKYRGWTCQFVRGLVAATQSVPLSAFDRRDMERTKRAGRELFAPELGGSFEVFKQRPLDARVLQYCAVDVYFFDEMIVALYDGLPPLSKMLVNQFSHARVNEWATRSGYMGSDRESVMCPF